MLTVDQRSLALGKKEIMLVNAEKENIEKKEDLYKLRPLWIYKVEEIKRIEIDLKKKGKNSGEGAWNISLLEGGEIQLANVKIDSVQSIGKIFQSYGIIWSFSAESDFNEWKKSDESEYIDFIKIENDEKERQKNQQREQEKLKELREKRCRQYDELNKSHLFDQIFGYIDDDLQSFYDDAIDRWKI